MNFKKYKIIELAGHSILSNNINIKNIYKNFKQYKHRNIMLRKRRAAIK